MSVWTRLLGLQGSGRHRKGRTAREEPGRFCSRAHAYEGMKRDLDNQNGHRQNAGAALNFAQQIMNVSKRFIPLAGVKLGADLALLALRGLFLGF